MLNSRFNNKRFNDGGLTPGTGVNSAIVAAKLGPDINKSKYVFIQTNGTQIIRRVNLSDFLDGNSGIGIYFQDDNIRDLPNKDIKTSVNPFSNGSKVISEKFPDKQISLELKVIANNHYDLEATLIDLKTRFNTGGSLQINENGYLKYIDVYLDSFEIDATSGLGQIADITVVFLSVDPIKKSKTITLSKLGLIGDSNISISTVDSNEAITPKFIIPIKSVTNTVDSIIISYDGFDIKYTGNIIEGDVIEFDGKEGTCLVNSLESDFDGTIRDIKAGIQTAISITFEGSGEPTFSTYILYNNLSL